MGIYCFQQILEMQQQLAVAVATDRKKAIMIEQLDKVVFALLVVHILKYDH